MAITYSSQIKKFNDLNDKVYRQIAVIQLIATRFLDEGVFERMRFRMKNEVLILYRQVIQNMDLLKAFKAGKATKAEVQTKYATIMAEQLDEQTLRRLDEQDWLMFILNIYQIN